MSDQPNTDRQSLDAALRGLPATSSDPWLAGRVLAELEARERARQWMAQQRGAALAELAQTLRSPARSFSQLWRELRSAMLG